MVWHGWKVEGLFHQFFSYLKDLNVFLILRASFVSNDQSVRSGCPSE